MTTIASVSKHHFTYQPVYFIIVYCRPPLHQSTAHDDNPRCTAVPECTEDKYQYPSVPACVHSHQRMVHSGWFYTLGTSHVYSTQCSIQVKQYSVLKYSVLKYSVFQYLVFHYSVFSILVFSILVFCVRVQVFSVSLFSISGFSIQYSSIKCKDFKYSVFQNVLITRWCTDKE